MTVVTVIRLILLAVMMAALLWPIGVLRRDGFRRAAWGHGLMATGILLAQIHDVLPGFDRPWEHWSYWPTFCFGMGLLLVGTTLVVSGGRGRGGKTERTSATR